MKLEDVHALIDAEPFVDILDQGADDSSDETNDSREPRRDVTSSGGDTDQTGDSAGASTHNRELALVADEINSDPAEDTSGSCDVGIEGSEHGADSCVEGRTTIEAEPTEPDEDSAEEDEGGVVGLAVRLLAVVLSLSENHGVGESSPAGGDMHRSSTSEIERRKVEEPAIGIPCPAGNRAVDDSRPQEAKHKRRHDTSTLEATTNHNLNGASAEHELVEAEDDLGDV